MAAASIVLAACTTTEVQQPGSKADLKEAARLNTQMGIDYMRKGQYELSLEKLQRALEQDSDLAAAHSAIALLYQRRDEPKLARKHFKKALDLNESDPGAMNNYGIFLCGQGEVEDAEEIFVEAARSKENRQPADSWANAGVCVRRDPKRLDKSEEYLREALRLNPRHENALAQMAIVCFTKQDYLRARAFLQRYEAIAKDTPQTLSIGAQIERKLGDVQSARAFERRLRSEFPDSPETEAMLNNAGKR
jgi:type IV pilus assembly protein PilF